MKTYRFTFVEKSDGFISIKSETQPTEEDVVQAILKGESWLTETKYSDIKLVNEE